MTFNSQRPTSTGSGVNFVAGGATEAGGALAVSVANEVGQRFDILGNGQHEWGDGTNAVDTFLKRIGAGLLDAKIISRQPVLFDHFAYGAGAFNSHVPQNWVTTETGAATPFAPGATGATIAIATTGATTNNGEEIAGKLVGWKPSSLGTGQRLVMEARLSSVGATTATDGDFALGLANAVSFTNSLPYVVGASSLYTTSVPTEFAGFHYSSIPTSGTLFNSAAAGATGNFIGIVTEKLAAAPTAVSSAVAKTSSMMTFRIELDSAGNATFWIADTLVGTVALAVTAATALTPYIVGNAKNSHANTITIDYIAVASVQV